MELIALQVDWSMRIADIIMLILASVVIPTFLAFARALFVMRDSVVKLIDHMGTEQPPIGVLGDIAHLKRVGRRHRDWLIKSNIIDPSADDRD